LDTRKIEELGWAPVIDLRDGLIEVIRWINKDWENLKDEPMEFEFIP
jgi:nucleoside-diphosphate-sugar epimerase